MGRPAFWRDRRGAVSLMAAGSAAAVIGLAALAVDLGSAFLQTRQLQGIADLAAIAAASDLPHAEDAVLATLAANGWRGPVRIEVVRGRYVADPALAPAARFQATAVSPDAARVRLNGQADLFFGQAIVGKSGLPISRAATAARTELASFSIGTRLASLNGGVANALLGGLTGSQVNLSVMDYRALLDADVDLFGYLDALATDLHLQGASYDRVLAADISTGTALGVLADRLADSGDNAAANAARALAKAAGAATPAHLDRLLDLGPYGPQDHVAGGSGANVSLSALDVASAMLQLANGSRQVQLDLGVGLPGLADVDAWLAIGEPPNGSAWMAITNDHAVIIRTAQTRLYVEAKLLGGGLLALLGGSSIKIPLLIEAASGEAHLSAIDCDARSVGLAVRPSVGMATIAEVDKSKLNDFKHPLALARAPLVTTPLLKASGLARADLGGLTWKPVSFSDADIRAGIVKTVATDDIARASVSSLLGNLDLQVQLLGLGVALGQGPVTAALRGVLSAAAAPLDQVVNTLTGVLGVGLGEADVRVNGLRCRDAALVA